MLGRSRVATDQDRAAPARRQCASCLGRRKGATRPFGMGLRPTLPPPGGSRLKAGCWGAQRVVDKRGAVVRVWGRPESL